MRASALSLRAALAIVLFLSSHGAAAQSGGPPSAVGADRIRAVLTEHPEWICAAPALQSDGKRRRRAGAES